MWTFWVADSCAYRQWRQRRANRWNICMSDRLIRLLAAQVLRWPIKNIHQERGSKWRFKPLTVSYLLFTGEKELGNNKCSHSTFYNHERFPGSVGASCGLTTSTSRDSLQRKTTHFYLNVSGKSSAVGKICFVANTKSWLFKEMTLYFSELFAPE